MLAVDGFPASGVSLEIIASLSWQDCSVSTAFTSFSEMSPQTTPALHQSAISLSVLFCLFTGFFLSLFLFSLSLSKEKSGHVVSEYLVTQIVNVHCQALPTVVSGAKGFPLTGQLLGKLP